MKRAVKTALVVTTLCVAVAGLCLVGCDRPWGGAEPTSGLELSEACEVALYVDSTQTLGELTLWNDANNLYVRYSADPGWCLDKTHLAVSTTLEGLPHDGQGQPVYNKYPFKLVHRGLRSVYIDIVPLAELGGPGTTLCIAAHVSLVNKPIRLADEAWGGLHRLPGESWACYTTYVVTP